MTNTDSDDAEQQSEVKHPIFGLSINDDINSPFADLYLDFFPEWYEVE